MFERERYATLEPTRTAGLRPLLTSCLSPGDGQQAAHVPTVSAFALASWRPQSSTMSGSGRYTACGYGDSSGYGVSSEDGGVRPTLRVAAPLTCGRQRRLARRRRAARRMAGSGGRIGSHAPPGCARCSRSTEPPALSRAPCRPGVRRRVPAHVRAQQRGQRSNHLQRRWDGRGDCRLPRTHNPRSTRARRVRPCAHVAVLPTTCRVRVRRTMSYVACRVCT